MRDEHLGLTLTADPPPHPRKEHAMRDDTWG